jgi:hypothetical protein
MSVAMQREVDNIRELDKKMAAVCGLYCEACSWFISTTEWRKGTLVQKQIIIDNGVGKV